MKEKNMTALISCFVKSYHYKNYKCRIFSDSYADKILKENEYDQKKATYIKCDFTTDEWINNIINSDYDKNKISFNSLLGISYYLTYDEFSNMIKNISNIICDGSSIIFDYPTYEQSDTSKCNESLAIASNNKMKSKYTYKEIEKILSDNNLYIYMSILIITK